MDIESGRPPETPDTHRVRVAGVSDLLAAVAPLLGFLPERSLVLLCVTDGRVAMSMRHDLILDETGSVSDDLETVIAQLASLCAPDTVGEVYAVIVDDRHPATSPVYAAVFDLLVDALVGRDLDGGFVVPVLEHGARWHQVAGAGPRSTTTGVLPDPRTTPVALAHAVVGGRRVLRTRAELVDSLAPLPECEAAVCPVHDPSRPRRDGGTTVPPEVGLQAVMTSLRRSSRRSATSCRRLETVGTAITVAPVRDALLALAVTELRDQAEEVWRAVARRSRGPAQTAAATLLAHLHYIGGDGAAAGVALDVALAADPRASLALLLDRSLRAGMHPSALWELLDDSYAIAADLGVALPPPVRPLAG